MKTTRLTQRLAAVFFALPALAFADTFNDDFLAGINPTNWQAWSNTTRFSVTPTNGLVRIQSTTGTTNDFYWGCLFSQFTAYGNFDVSVDFTNANLAWHSGGPGNQAQLNCIFGNFGSATNFLVVRSDESAWGQNAHIWIGSFVPNGTNLLPVIYTNLSYGTLRITRTNSLVKGYLNSSLIAQTTCVTAPAHFQIILQNNYTEDAISIAYDNFRLSADQLVLGPPLTIQPAANNRMVLSWPTWGVNWITNYVPQTASRLNPPDWQTITTTPGTNAAVISLTNSVSSATGFYRLFKQR